MFKKIKFIPKNNDVLKFLNPPKPSSLYVPEWYKKSEKYLFKDKLVVNNYGTNIGLKGCLPFIESLTHGYIIELWTDILVTEDEEDAKNNPVLNWTNTPDPVKTRLPELGSKIPRPISHYDRMFNWVLQWGTALPKGYSLFFTHPFNRFDLPFTTLSGVVDSDNYYGEGAVPFFIKEGFEGVIKAGTPIIQIFPVKRESWVSECSTDLMDARDRHQWLLRSAISGYYKNKMRKKKHFK
jgi:hypothetical protein